MYEIILYWLKNVERPKHLQLRAADGTYLWMASSNASLNNTAARINNLICCKYYRAIYTKNDQAMLRDRTRQVY
jgi:hypothetical protein